VIEIPDELSLDRSGDVVVEDAEDRFRSAARQLADVVSGNPIMRFVPNRVQWEFIRNQQTKLLAIIGANKVGKSTIVCLEGISRALGFRPYLAPDDPDYFVFKPNGERMPVPNKGQVAAEDFPQGIRKIQWPMWQQWLPPDQYKVANTERGVPRELWIDVSSIPWADTSSPLYPYSRVYFYAYAQGREAFAGFDPEWILNDEPPPRDIWVEQMRGLIPSGGGWMGAMTLVTLDQAWVYQLFAPAPETQPWEKADEDHLEVSKLSAGLTRHMVTGTMRDNLVNADGSGALEEKDIEDYREMLALQGDGEEMAAVRIEGDKVHLLGTEWGQYYNEKVHVLEEHREPDPEMPQVHAVDPHPTKPYAMLWVEINEDDELYIWAESFDRRIDTHDRIAEFIKQTEQWKETNGHFKPRSSGLEATVRFMDPLAKTNERGEGKDSFQQLSDRGLHFIPWKRANKTSRIRNVREYFLPTWGPDARPRLTISPRCKFLRSQIPMYREKMPSDPDLMERKGDMLKVADDLVDCLIAICNMGYTYKVLHSLSHVEETRKKRRETPMYDESQMTEAVGGY
jgi:hypothetical protein